MVVAGQTGVTIPPVGYFSHGPPRSCDSSYLHDFSGAARVADCARYLPHAAKAYAVLRAAHMADHEQLFRRVELELAAPADDEPATDQRVPA